MTQGLVILMALIFNLRDGLRSLSLLQVLAGNSLCGAACRIVLRKAVTG